MKESANIIMRLYNWLATHRSANLIILIIYYLFVVLPHEIVGLKINYFFGKILKLSRSQYNMLIVGIGITLLLSLGYIFMRNVRENPSKNKIWFYLIATIIFSIVILKYLFVINIEMVHYVQYALFAFLCFPLIQNYWQTLLWATLAGSIDEAYQYFYLTPRTEYYDFNDVLTNLIGAAFGLVFLRAHDFKGGVEGWKPFLKSSVFAALIMTSLIILGLNLGGYLDIYPSEDSTAIRKVVNVMPEEFWSIIPSKKAQDIIYHVVLPVEGLVLTILLWLFYIPLGRR